MRMLERAGLVPDAALQHAGRLSPAPPGATPGALPLGAPVGAAGEAPPPRHQRLPAQGRRHPELPLGPVEPARSVLLRGPHRVLRRRRRRLRRRAGRAGHPHRAGARQASSSSRRRTRWPPCAPRSGSTRSTWSCSIRRCRSGSSGRSLDVPYGVVLHGAEVTVPGRLPGSRAALARVLRGRGSSCRPAATRRPRPGAPCPDLTASLVEIPPGVDAGAIVPLKAAERRAARAAARAARHGPLLVERRAGSSRARAWTCSSRRPTAWPPRTRTSWWPSPATAGSWATCGGWPAEPGDGPGARAGEPGGPGRPPRRGRRLRHGLPQPLAGPGAGGVRDRLPRGGRRRRAPGGRRQRRGLRGRGRRR